MIEIILRKDMTEFEPKPFFGHSQREVLTYAAIAVACCGLGYLLVARLGLGYEPVIVALLAVGAAIGWVGFGRPHGMQVERYVRLRRANASHPQTMRYAPPEVAPVSDKAADDRSRAEARRDRRAARADMDELRRLPDEAFGGLVSETDAGPDTQRRAQDVLRALADAWYGTPEPTDTDYKESQR